MPKVEKIEKGKLFSNFQNIRKSLLPQIGLLNTIRDMCFEIDFK